VDVELSGSNDIVKLNFEKGFIGKVANCSSGKYCGINDCSLFFILFIKTNTCIFITICEDIDKST